MYDLDNGRTVALHGPLDKRLGISDKRSKCETCGEHLQTCNGHFGHVKLVLPCFHVGYFKKTIQILQSICKVIFSGLEWVWLIDAGRTVLVYFSPNSIGANSLQA